MLSIIALAFLVALFLLLMPYIIALGVAVLAVLFCLTMAGICWIRNLFTPTK